MLRVGASGSAALWPLPRYEINSHQMTEVPFGPVWGGREGALPFKESKVRNIRIEWIIKKKDKSSKICLQRGLQPEIMSFLGGVDGRSKFSDDWAVGPLKQNLKWRPCKLIGSSNLNSLKSEAHWKLSTRKNQMIDELITIQGKKRKGKKFPVIDSEEQKCNKYGHISMLAQLYYE